MELWFTSTFKKAYKKLPISIQEQTQEALVLFESNPSHPSLGFKKMKGTRDIWELRITQSYRLTLKRDGNITIVRYIGTHDILRKEG